MAFAQLTYRGHRDLPLGPRIETWASASRSGARRLADANERRDWRIHAVGPAAMRHAVRRRRTGVGPDQSVYARLDDHRSVPVGLSVGALPHHQGGGQMHTLLDLRGNIPSFIPLGWRSCTYVHALDIPCHKLRRGSWLREAPAFMCCTAGVTRQVEHRCIASIRRRRLDRHHLRPDHLPYTRQDYPELLRRIRQGPRSGRR